MRDHQERPAPPGLAGTPPFAARRRRVAAATIIEVHGELDIRAARELEPLFDSCVQETADAVVADYRGVVFIDSIAIGQLITVRKRLAQDLRRLVVVSRLPKVRRVLAMTGTDRMVPVYESLPDALAAVDA